MGPLPINELVGVHVQSAFLPLLMAVPGIMQGLSSIFGGASKSRAEAQAANERNSVNLYGEQNRDDAARATEQLNRDKFGLTAPRTRMSTAAAASLGKHKSPVKFNWGGPGSVARGGPLPSYSDGGMQAAMDDPTMKQMQDNVLHASLVDQLRGGSIGGKYTQEGDPGFTPITMGGGGDVRSAFPARRTPPSIGESSGFDNFLGGAGLTTGILGTLGNLFKKQNGDSGIQDGV